MAVASLACPYASVRPPYRPSPGPTSPHLAAAAVADVHTGDPRWEFELELLLLALGHTVPGPGPAAAQPLLCDTDLARLPVHKYVRRDAAAGMTHAASATATATATATGTSAAGASATAPSPNSSSSPYLHHQTPEAQEQGGLAFVPASASASASAYTCPVCLEAVVDGALMMTLPCCHQFHTACITPWLRRKGRAASCPLCKTQVFS